MEVKVGIKRNAVLCILRHKQELLLLKRNNPPNKGLFTPVGGKIDPFEKPMDTAIRETLEETGIKVSKFNYCGSLIETSPTKYNWNSLVYVAEIDFIPAPECNEGELRWIPMNELTSIPTPATDAFIYDYVMSAKPFFFDAYFDENLKLVHMIEAITNKQCV